MTAYHGNSDDLVKRLRGWAEGAGSSGGVIFGQAADRIEALEGDITQLIIQRDAAHASYDNAKATLEFAERVVEAVRDCAARDGYRGPLSEALAAHDKETGA